LQGIPELSLSSLSRTVRRPVSRTTHSSICKWRRILHDPVKAHAADRMLGGQGHLAAIVCRIIVLRCSQHGRRHRKCNVQEALNPPARVDLVGIRVLSAPERYAIVQDAENEGLTRRARSIGTSMLVKVSLALYTAQGYEQHTENTIVSGIFSAV